MLHVILEQKICVISSFEFLQPNNSIYILILYRVHMYLSNADLINQVLKYFKRYLIW